MSTPRLQEVLDGSTAAYLRDVHTGMPGEIVDFDKSKGTATVKPLLQLPHENEEGVIEWVQLANIPHVPVLQNGSGSFRIGITPKQGDEVKLFFAEAPIDGWQANGGAARAAWGRRFQLADAVAVLGLRNASKAWQGLAEDKMTIGHDTGPGIVLTASEVQLGARVDDAATEAVIKGSQYRQNQKTFHTKVATLANAAATAAAALSSSPSGGPVVGAIPLQLALQQLAQAFTDYETEASSRGDDLSTVVKTK